MARGVSLHIGLNEVDPNHYKDGDGNPWKGELAACEADAHAMVDLATAQKFEVRGPLLSIVLALTGRPIGLPQTSEEGA